MKKKAATRTILLQTGALLGLGLLIMVFTTDRPKVLRWGFIDKRGKVTIRPQFALAGNMKGGLAVVAVHKPDEDAPEGKSLRFGYIDKTGKYLVEPSFQFAADFSEGLARVQVGKLWGYIDKTGKFAIPARFSECSDFSEGLAVVREGTNPYGYVGKAGTFVLKPNYYTANNFSEGLAVVKSGMNFSYIDKTGKAVIDLVYLYDQAYSFSNGLAVVGFPLKPPPAGKNYPLPVFDTNGRQIAVTAFSYINRAGKPVIFDLGFASQFKEGLGLAKLTRLDNNKDWHYVDKSGRPVPCSPIQAGEAFSEGLAAVGLGSGKWGYLNKHGKLAVPALYQRTYSFSEGLGLVKTEAGNKAKFAFVDPTGKVVIAPNFVDCHTFSEGLAAVCQED